MAMTRLDRAVAAFNAVHQTDPNGASQLYHERVAHYVARLSLPSLPSEHLVLAANCQHIKRWTVPRSSYPEGLAGYKRWRAGLNKFHADEGSRIMEECGYTPDSDALIFQRLRDLLQKRNLDKDPEAQLLENAVCLVFLEAEFKDFAKKVTEDKMIDIIRKTWKKMSADGHQVALELAGSLDENLKVLVLRALEPVPEAEGASQQ